MDHAAAFLAENRAFAELFRDVDASVPVPTCPGWSLAQLLRHVGRGDRWAAQIVRQRLDAFLDPRAVEGGKPPPDPAGAISWLHGGAHELVTAVEAWYLETPPTPVWTFLGPRPADWWIRRRLHETVVHRADAAIATGAEFRIEADIAADGITEWLERVAIQAGSDGSPLPLAQGNTLHLHATDPGLGDSGEWTVRVQEGAIVWSHAHGKGSAALRGGAAELLLALTRRLRVSDAGIELFGDDKVWQDWLDRTPL
ncbi:maleylpyruvate isomerase family mycothiol-dependent enzyme [Mycobacterium sp.]|uniref:maleylpyruvate isomerase family mycothiol-dependent enzyme n=1 Tax=Mycobacterium sp. TaxID=1785 RepID=UPI0025D858F2|nr:maleylpyruvate isomerase family mycothiol-dependent enzyme [Mycobacterium sp.]MBW0014085.1 maleylpyruvate isomerase family mycothiol-dependent enzyme [Mycobacterium sp.]